MRPSKKDSWSERGMMENVGSDEGYKVTTVIRDPQLQVKYLKNVSSDRNTASEWALG